MRYSAFQLIHFTHWQNIKKSSI